jgi:hypothetical protein
MSTTTTPQPSPAHRTPSANPGNPHPNGPRTTRAWVPRSHGGNPTLPPERNSEGPTTCDAIFPHPSFYSPTTHKLGSELGCRAAYRRIARADGIFCLFYVNSSFLSRFCRHGSVVRWPGPLLLVNLGCCSIFILCLVFVSHCAIARRSGVPLRRPKPKQAGPAISIRRSTIN